MPKIFKKKATPDELGTIASLYAIKQAELLSMDKKFLKEFDLNILQSEKLFIEASIANCFTIICVIAHSSWPDAAKDSAATSLVKYASSQLSLNLYMGGQGKSRREYQAMADARIAEYVESVSNTYEDSDLTEFSKMALANMTGRRVEDCEQCRRLTRYFAKIYASTEKLFSRYKIIFN